MRYSGRVLKLTWALGGWLLGGLLLAGLDATVACSAASTDHGTPDDASLDVANGDEIPIGVGDGKAPLGHWPAILLVDGLGAGAATATNGAALTLDDVRVCVFDSNDKPVTTYAKPDDTPMPFANYPGVRLGRGVDLGSYAIPDSGVVTIDVFRAEDLSDDAVWSTSRQNYTCASIACNSGPSCKTHAEVSVTLGDDVNVVALLDSTSDGGVGIEARNAIFLDPNYNGAPGSLYAGFVDFSGWHSGEMVAAKRYDDMGDAGPLVTSLVDQLQPDVATMPALVTDDVASSYDGAGIRFEANGGANVFSQSFDSIAYVTNPTLDPPTFYGIRENFVFALVGDPADATSVLNDGGRDPGFDGRGLHFIAVPYASPEPMPASDP
jgi:hypothetical protein